MSIIEHNGNMYAHLASDDDYKYYLIESVDKTLESQIVVHSEDLGKTVTATLNHDLLGDIDVTNMFEHEFLERLWHEAHVYDSDSAHNDQSDPIDLSIDDQCALGNEISCTTYHPNGKIARKTWYKGDGIKHRDNDKPAEISYREDGTVECERWLDKNEEIKREEWYQNGKKHRDNDLPAVNCYRPMYENGYYPDGEIEFREWFIDGKRHRDNDLPAIIEYYPNGVISKKAWYQDDELYREIHYDPDGEQVENEITIN